MSSTPANDREGSNNSRSADRRQFSDLIEGPPGRAGGRGLGELGCRTLVLSHISFLLCALSRQEPSLLSLPPGAAGQAHDMGDWEGSSAPGNPGSINLSTKPTGYLWNV